MPRPPSLAQQTRAALRTLGHVARRRFSQHFLIDRRVLNSILDAAALQPSSCVLEIGAGIGTLTVALAERARRVVAVELDRELCRYLEQLCRDWDSVEVVQADFLKLDMEQALSASDGSWWVVANIPYAITTPIINRLLEVRRRLKRIVLMVQEEVADRLAARPGSKAYSAVSVHCQYAADVRIVRKVARGSFLPPPQVGSAIVALECRPHDPLARDEKLLEQLVRGAFGQRRKTLVNAVASSAKLNVEPGDLARTLGKLGVDPKSRAEQIPVRLWVALANEIVSMREGCQWIS